MEDCHSPKSIKSPSAIKITLVGQPNSGKTTLFNLLTHSNYKTSNYSGTTVEYSIGELSTDFSLKASVIDSPGIHSFHSMSPDEKVTYNVLFDHDEHSRPEIVLVTVDSSQIARHLYLANQVLQCGFKTVVVLTMSDLLEKKRLRIDAKKLSDLIHCPVVIVNPRDGKGSDLLVQEIRKALEEPVKLITKPLPTTEQAILDQYDAISKIEEAVVTSKPNLDKINQKIFNTRKPEADKTSLKLDRYFLNPILGLFFFAVIMSVLFASVFWVAQPLMDMLSDGFEWLESVTVSVVPDTSWFGHFLSHGVIQGAGAVFVFFPQIAILFIVMGFLEDSGYLARGAMLIDLPLSKLGLNGRSFVPMLSGFACAIPATMAARSIPDRRERLLTIFILPLMTCSARLPVYALLIAFLVPPDKPWLAGLLLSGIYMISLFNGILIAGLVNKFRRQKKNESNFMLELPAYRRPVLRHILRSSFHKSYSYIQNAGLTIFVCAAVIWALTYFPNYKPEIPDSSSMSAEERSVQEASLRINGSYASSMARYIEPALQPLGWDWRIGVGLISAFAAREVFVSSISLTYQIADATDDPKPLLQAMQEAKNSDGKPSFGLASVIALLLFFMFAMQCTSTLAVVRKETGSWRMPILQQISFTLLAYLFALSSVKILELFGIS